MKKEEKISSKRDDILMAFDIIEKLKEKESAKQLLENQLDLETNENKVEVFYIHCSDAPNMTENLYLHLEKLFVDNIDEYLDCFYFPEHYRDYHFALLITNDETVLKKYRFAINYDEFVMLCGFKSYNEKKVLINKGYIRELNREVFGYFIQILVNDIVSATMEVPSRNRLTKFNLNHLSYGIKTRTILPKKEWLVPSLRFLGTPPFDNEKLIEKN